MVNSLILQSIGLAFTGLVSLGSITIVLLLILSKDGFYKGLGYTLGYFLGYVLIGNILIVLSLFLPVNFTNQVNSTIPIFLLALGTLLLFLGLRNLRRGPKTSKENKGFLSSLDGFNSRKSFMLGAAITVINVKNLALYMTAMSGIILVQVDILDKILLTFLISIIFCIGVFFPVLIYLMFPESSEVKLTSFKAYLDTHSHKLSIYLPIFFSFLLIFKGVTDLL